MTVEKIYPMAMITAPGKVEFRERRLPKLSPKGVLIGVKASSICGSDLHIFKGRHPSVSLPVAIGHELSGEVLKIGRKVSKVKEGDRVVVEPVIVCGGCILNSKEVGAVKKGGDERFKIKPFVQRCLLKFFEGGLQ